MGKSSMRSDSGAKNERKFEKKVQFYTKVKDTVAGLSANMVIGKYKMVPLLCALVFSTLQLTPVESDTTVGPITRTPRFVLVPAMNGTVQLLDSKSGTPLWAFSSGPAIYSSYQAPADHSNGSESGYLSNYFIDLTEEWDLSGYYCSKKQCFQRQIFARTVDEMFRETPKVFDGVMIVGSGNDTFFELSIKSGRLIHSNSVDQMNDTIYITRKDYLLQGLDLVSKKLLWNLSIAQIDAFYKCNDREYHGWSRFCRVGVYYPPLVNNNRVFASGESTKDTESVQKMLTRALSPLPPQGPINDGSLEYRAKVNDHPVEGEVGWNV